MKKVLLFLSVVFMFTACVQVDKNKDFTNTEQLIGAICSNGVYLYVIDSCEYIRVSNGVGFTHKGNCRFCEERRKKEIMNNQDNLGILGVESSKTESIW